MGNPMGKNMENEMEAGPLYVGLCLTGICTAGDLISTNIILRSVQGTLNYRYTRNQELVIILLQDRRILSTEKVQNVTY